MSDRMNMRPPYPPGPGPRPGPYPPGPYPPRPYPPGPYPGPYPPVPRPMPYPYPVPYRPPVYPYPYPYPVPVPTPTPVPTPVPIVGGWQPLPESDSKFASAIDVTKYYVVTTFGESADFNIVSAEYQVVNGINYRVSTYVYIGNTVRFVTFTANNSMGNITIL